MKKLSQLLLILAIVAAGACGNANSHWPGLVSGSDTLDQISETVTNATLLCIARTGRVNTVVAFQPVLKLNIQYYYGIDKGRAYKQKDIDNCKDTLMVAVSTSADCNFAAAPKCFLKPVDKITGASH